MDKDSKNAAIALGAVAVVGLGTMLLMRKPKAAVGKHPGDDIIFYVRLKSTFAFGLLDVGITIDAPMVMNVPEVIVNLDSMKPETFNIIGIIPDDVVAGAYDVVVTVKNSAVGTVTKTFPKALNIV